jgi:hypothetical protein
VAIVGSLPEVQAGYLQNTGLEVYCCITLGAENVGQETGQWIDRVLCKNVSP